MQIYTSADIGQGHSLHPATSQDMSILLWQMYNAGLADYTDIEIGIHPYSWANNPMRRPDGNTDNNECPSSSAQGRVLKATG